MDASISRFTPLLLAGLAVLLAACSATGSTTGSTTATPPSAGASSGSAPATSTAPASPAQASASPNGSASAPTCATTQLTLRIGGGLVSGGADVYYIYFTNTGGTVCTLRGYPGVSAVTGPSDSASQIGSDAKRVATSPVATQLLKPGQVAQATLRFAKTGNYLSPQCQHVNVVFLKIFPPGDTTAAYAGGLEEQVCAETTLPTMTITTVVPDGSGPPAVNGP
jgi:hypothetical protein